MHPKDVGVQIALCCAALCLLVSTARSADAIVDGYKCSRLTSYFYGEPLKTRLAKFSDADLEKQFAIYICGNQYLEPPAMYFAMPFAREGHRAANFLRTKLAQTTDDGTIRDIIMVFSEMQRQGTYPVASDRELIQLIHSSVARIKDATWRQFAERKVTEITEPSR